MNFLAFSGTHLRYTKYLIFLSVWIIVTELQAQCNTTLNKLLAEKSVNNDDRFGSGLAANDQYMVVTAENSDTLGVLYAGAAYVFEKTAAGWAYRALLVPSDPDEFDFFGNNVAIDADGNTIVIINRNYDKGGVYIYEKPVSGWENMQETAKITLPDYLEYLSALDISDDGTTIAVSNPFAIDTKFYVLYKPEGGWHSSLTPEVIAGPDFGFNSNQFGMDILLQDDYLYLSSDNDPTGNGIYVYRRNNMTYDFLAKLSISNPSGQVGYFGRHMALNGDIIATMGIVVEAGQKMFVFRKNGEWTNTTETAQISIHDTESYGFPYPIQFISPTELVASVLVKEEAYYTGKVLMVTADDPNWQNVTQEVIYQQEELSLLSEFTGQMVWNGYDLIRTVGLKSEGLTFRHAAVSLTLSNGVWGSLQHVTVSRYNSSNVNFGTSVLKSGNVLFAGAPFDGFAGKGAGAVYLYERVGDEFIKTHTILPSRRKIRPGGGSDAGFGYSLATHGDELAVGAPSFSSTGYNYGKIFLYRRTGPSWTTATLYDSLIAPDELILNHVGAALIMNDRFLFAAAYNNFNNEHTNAILVYEKINDVWEFQQLIKFARPLDKSWPSIQFSLLEDKLMVGSAFSLEGGVAIFERNDDNGMWEQSLFLDAYVFSGFGGDVKLLTNHFFVGVPAYDFEGIPKSGAVFVYAKLPEQEWTLPLTPVAIIGAENPIEGAYFGSSIDVIGNTLVVGAPGKFLTNDSQVRTVAGNTYIIQAQDYFWQNTIQFQNLQGDRYAYDERDHFGSDIGVDEEYFYIGARSEHTSTGMFSGSVYYIPTPPVIFLNPPVCAGSEVIELNAYPFGGTWTGPGIDDPAGKFNPLTAGTGIATLTYTTPNCFYQGTVQIEVKEGENVEQISPAEVMICSEGEVNLQLASIPGATYDWQYRPEGLNSFVSIGTGGPEKRVTNPGQYFASIEGLTCSTESPVFTVAIEGNIPLSVGPQPVICSHDEVVPLVASNNSGTWQGTGVQNDQFHPAGLPNGIHELIYHFTTPAGCLVALKDSIKVNVVAKPLITRVPGDYCETGSADLLATPDDPTFSYTWYFNSSGDLDMDIIEKPLTATVTVFEQGYYRVQVSNDDGCSGLSDVINIGFTDDLTYQLIPGEDSEVNLCNEPAYPLSIQSRPGANFIWEYSGNPGEEPFERISSGTTNLLLVDQSGFYRVSGEYGFCSFQSMPVSLRFNTDSLYVPNVFTPNGDAYNATFRVESSYPVYQLRIFNRYGNEIYSSTGTPWDGGTAPTGVYYWLVRYAGCDVRDKEAKGWVSLIR